MIASSPRVHVYAAGAAVREAVVAKLRHAGIAPAAPPVIGSGTVVLAAGSTIDEALSAGPAALFRSSDHRLMVAADMLNPAGVLRAVRTGARTILQTTEATPEQFSAAVHSAMNGESRLPYGVLVRLLSGGAELSMPAGPGVRVPAVPPLTDRQLAVLTLVADGHGNTEIARTLSCSEHTVKNVMYELMARLQVRNRAHAVARGVRTGLI